MIAKKWQGDPGCFFCGELETVDHLLFDCPISKIVWGVIAICFGQRNGPKSFKQFWSWIGKSLSGGEGREMDLNPLNSFGPG
jgi:hypothetical protein